MQSEFKQEQNKKNKINTNNETTPQIMKNLTTLFAVLLFMTISANVMAQNTATESATASANIVSAIDIQKNMDLTFGDIAVSGTAGQITILPQEDLDINFSVEEMELTTGTRNAAKFTITGQEDYLFSINLPETITISSGSDDMTIETLMNLNENSNTLTNGSIELYVGGTLHVNGDEDPGLFDGTFDVTVAYE